MKKRKLFFNILQHFSGNHANCNHDAATGIKCKVIKDNKVLEILGDLINETAQLFGDFDPKLTSNYNENFHSIKARYLTKTLNLGYSWKGRICAAILQYNEQYNWIQKAYDALHLPPLSATCLFQLFKRMERSRKKVETNKAKKSTQEARNQRKNRQIAVLKQEKVNNPEAHL